MRGTHRLLWLRYDPRRFIPAYAGNALDTALIQTVAPVHPRVCGERTGEYMAAVVAYGSSPRMRGTPPSWRLELVSVRFIPAYAGNAALEYGQAMKRMVHPRVCGERFVARN